MYFNINSDAPCTHHTCDAMRGTPSTLFSHKRSKKWYDVRGRQQAAIPMMDAHDQTAPATAGSGATLRVLVSNNGGFMDALTILRAARMAADWHAGQRRKGAAGEPYVNHLIEVAELVAEAEPGNTDLVIAALLHDAIEDQQIAPDEIAGLFGKRVASLVMEVTDDKSLPKQERKRLQVETAAKKSRDARLLKLADKTSNLRSLAKSPPADWPNERRRDYVAWAAAVAASLSGISTWLDREFEAAKALALESIPADVA
jgi:GTP diphosphokinase / guanosine-3',5'-bis(diphosphate) 3'-diphosphatase